MLRSDYIEYGKDVAEFMGSEGITNLSSGHFECPDCKVEFDDSGKCPKCGGDRECFNEPHFSWSSCDCCGTTLGGDREYASGYNPATKGIQEYSICSDCVYYAEYGQLDDMTMMDMVEDVEKVEI